MKMCEKGNYTSEMLNEYCARLADVELFEDSQVPAKVIIVGSFENANLKATNIDVDRRN